METLESVECCVDRVIDTVGKRLVVGLPLGLGKPNQFINALYERACQDPEIDLTILTALSLERPHPAPGLESRFLQPIFDRIFGDYCDLAYMQALRKGTLPDNVTVHEFFFKSGAFIGHSYAQQHYISTNYTHAPRDILAHGVNVVAQLLAVDERGPEPRYSYSCNPEVTLDLLPELLRRKQEGETIVTVGQVHRQLPFMENDALVDTAAVDFLIDNPACDTRLFAPPEMPISTTDYFIGLHASSLIADGTTLQIGIGSLGDAIVYNTELRHEKNDQYRQLLKSACHDEAAYRHALDIGGDAPFATGLYGNSEMFVDGFFYLIKAGIIKREVYDHLGIQTLVNQGLLNAPFNEQTLAALQQENLLGNSLDESSLAVLVHFGILNEQVSCLGQTLRIGDEEVPNDMSHERTRRLLVQQGMGDGLKNGYLMHGGFFLGPESFYQGLRDMPEEQRRKINMTAISYVNQLYGNEPLKRAQRYKARFINTVFTLTLNGAAVSDGTADAQVVSGVGGQYNFVAQAHELEGGRSILMLKSTRTKAGQTTSNIVFNYGHTTIPRHLRDIYVTEYGVADVRGKCDAEVIKAILNIADSRFQPELLARAKAAGKLPASYQIPEACRNNTPERLEALMQPLKQAGLYPAFPFGSAFTDAELKIGRALKWLKAEKSRGVGRLLSRALRQSGQASAEEQALLARMGLADAASFQEKLERRLLLAAFRQDAA